MIAWRPMQGRSMHRNADHSTEQRAGDVQELAALNIPIANGRVTLVLSAGKRGVLLE